MRNEYRVMGDVTAIILRKRGGVVKETLIDTCDLPRAMAFDGAWMHVGDRSFPLEYARGWLKSGSSVNLHTWLLQTPKGNVIDHFDHDGLNNRRYNLRVTSDAVNSFNRRGPAKNSVSGIRGVHLNRRENCWAVRFRINGHKYYLGNYRDKDEAERVARAFITERTMGYGDDIGS